MIRHIQAAAAHTTIVEYGKDDALSSESGTSTFQYCSADTLHWFFVTHQDSLNNVKSWLQEINILGRKSETTRESRSTADTANANAFADSLDIKSLKT